MSNMVRKTTRIAAPKMAAKPSSGAKTRFKAPSVTKTKKVLKAGVGGKKVIRKTVVKKAASHILSAPKGARTLTHRKIKQAVERVFKERYGADA